MFCIDTFTSFLCQTFSVVWLKQYKYVFYVLLCLCYWFTMYWYVCVIGLQCTVMSVLLVYNVLLCLCYWFTMYCYVCVIGLQCTVMSVLLVYNVLLCLCYWFTMYCYVCELLQKFFNKKKLRNLIMKRKK